MFDGGHIQVGAGKYYQCHGAIKKLGEELSKFGKKAYVVFSDATVEKKTKEKVADSLKNAGVDAEYIICELPSTMNSFHKMADELKKSGADMIVAVGGGRVIDISKQAGDIAEKPIFTVPTSAATCAAWAVLCVTYNEEGYVDHSEFLNHEIRGVFADLDILVDDCPVRYFAAGIADAMAKYPEFQFTMDHLDKEYTSSATSGAASLISTYTWNNYLERALKAIEDMKAGKTTADVEDMINMNIMLTGMVSDLSTGGKQLAVAHNIYNTVCGLQKEVRKNYLHGEIVGMAIPVQMAVNGDSEEDILKIRDMLKKMGIPTTLKEMNFDMSVVDELVDIVADMTIKGDATVKQQIRDGLKYVGVN